MGKIKKLLGVTAAFGAAICGAAYYRKKSGMNVTGDDDFEDDLHDDLSDKKILDLSTDGSDEENKKVTITFNKNKAKQVASETLDTIGDAMYTAKDKIIDTIGEDNIVEAKESVGKVKDKIVDKIGEDNINKAKTTISKVTDKAKEKADEIFTEENIDLAKDRAFDAFDKTKDVLKKASDKVMSLKKKENDDYSDVECVIVDDLDNDDFADDADIEEPDGAAVIEGDVFDDNIIKEDIMEAAEDELPAESSTGDILVTNEELEEDIKSDDLPPSNKYVDASFPVIDDTDNSSPVVTSDMVEPDAEISSDVVEPDAEISSYIDETNEDLDASLETDKVEEESSVKHKPFTQRFSFLAEDYDNSNQLKDSDEDDELFDDSFDVFDDDIVSEPITDAAPEDIQAVEDAEDSDISMEHPKKSQSVKYDFLADEIDEL